MLVMHQDSWERACPVRNQEECWDAVMFFVGIGDLEAVVVVFPDHSVRLERYGVGWEAELQELPNFLAKSIDSHICLKEPETQHWL
jgi:hypothetical protein